MRGILAAFKHAILFNPPSQLTCHPRTGPMRASSVYHSNFTIRAAKGSTPSASREVLPPMFSENANQDSKRSRDLAKATHLGNIKTRIQHAYFPLNPTHYTPSGNRIIACFN